MAEGQAGVYEGWELVDTDTTYTIGSGEDYENLKEAADDLKGLILQGTVTLQLTENITADTAGASFSGIIYAGGALVIDLNTHTWDYSSGSSDYPLTFSGPLSAILQNGKIRCSTTSISPPYALLLANGVYDIRINHDLTIDMDSKAYNYGMIFRSCRLVWDGPTEANVGSIVTGIAQLAYSAVGGTRQTPDPSVLVVGQGAIYIKYDGTVVT